MQLPPSENAHEIYAFKKGYRTAKAGLALHAMPSQIRYDATLRAYFQQGYEQYLETTALQKTLANQPRWRQKMIWWSMMLLAGLATAGLMIHNIKSESTSQNPPKTDPKVTSTIEPQSEPKAGLGTDPVAELESISEPQAPLPETSRKTAQANDPNQPSSQTSQKTEGDHLGLLNPQARADLMQNQAQHAKAQQTVPSLPVSDSEIVFKDQQLTTQVKAMTPVDQLAQPVPKFVRKVVFYNRILHAKGQTLTHHWYHQNRPMATVSLVIKSDDFRTWSSKQMTSAWAGAWRIDTKNEQGQVIDRFRFDYIAHNKTPSTAP